MEAFEISKYISLPLVILVAVFVMVFAEVVKTIGKKKNVKFDKTWISLVLMVVALAFSILFVPVPIPALPEWSDWPAVQTWLQSLALIAAAIIGVAVLVYNLIVTRIKAMLSPYLDEDLEPVDLPDEIK